MDQLHGLRGGETLGQIQARRGHRIKRVAAVAVVGLTPVIALGWVGCSADEPAPASGAVDPGGTFGAELTVTVKGRGRVMTTMPGLDCPSDCFAKYIFASKTADGAAGGVTLKAIPTPGSTFKGWSFATDPVGSRGRGPDQCNPVMRAGTQPSVGMSDMEITLPYGEVAGTPPAGKEAACGPYTTVPIVYKVTANFDEDNPIVDSGVDSGDGGTDEIVYDQPTVGASGGPMGITQGALYWVYSSSGYSGIAYGSNPSSSAIPQTPSIVLSPSSFVNIDLFEVEQYGVVYKTSSGGVYYVSAGTTSPMGPMGGSVGTCLAIAADAQDNVYCRTSSTIVKWTYPSYSTPETLFTGLGSGSDLVIENTTAYFSTTSAINSISISGADGGVASPTTVVGSRSYPPSGLESNSSYLWWVESGYLYRSDKFAGSIATNTNVIGTSATRIAPDTSSSYFWAAASSSIYRAYYAGGASTQVFRTGLSGITGVAADSQYVYWLPSDGRVRRALKN